MLHLSRHCWSHSQLDHNETAVTFDVINLKIFNKKNVTMNLIFIAHAYQVTIYHAIFHFPHGLVNQSSTVLIIDDL